MSPQEVTTMATTLAKAADGTGTAARTLLSNERS
jgi:hypothetical protein